MNAVTEVWAVFDHPNEHPESYVARRFLSNVPTEKFILSPKLEGIEQTLSSMGLIRVTFKNENPKVIQLWIHGNYGGDLN